MDGLVTGGDFGGGDSGEEGAWRDDDGSPRSDCMRVCSAGNCRVLVRLRVVAARGRVEVLEDSLLIFAGDEWSVRKYQQ